MARITTSGPWAHGTDAAFRAWLAEFFAMMTGCGLVQTADSGQINPATATWPGVNSTDAGFGVWRFNDSLQSVAPVFIKVAFGRGNSTANARGTLQVGTGSDGAGNITGLATDAHVMNGSAASAGPFDSYAIHREGLAAMAFKVGGSAGTIPLTFIVQRTVDNSGTPTGEGLHILRPAINYTSPAQVARLRFTPTAEATTFASIALAPVAFVPGGLVDGRVGLSPQVFPHWTVTPKQRPLLFSASNIRGEIATGQQFSMALVGSVASNYISLGTAFGNTLIGTPSHSDLSLFWDD
ncbi:MAG: hypothetical protein GX856_00995 [Gammaproteobacteria bacterium]|jgi:hypothetical protein|nr:hypothetical protein [Gammaproteobacteria bacterium]